jgi:hypothetical protein
MSLTGYHPLWDKIISQNLQAVADQGFHLEGTSPYNGTAYRGVHCNVHSLPISEAQNLKPIIKEKTIFTVQLQPDLAERINTLGEGRGLFSLV